MAGGGIGMSVASTTTCPGACPGGAGIGHAARTPYRSSAATHAGSVRTSNEDAYLDRPEAGLWAVADGAGGHRAGQAASLAVTDAVAAAIQGGPRRQGLPQFAALLRRRVAEAHAALRAQAAAIHGADGVMAATLALLAAADGRYLCLWAGDARVYRLRAGNLVPLTRDHSLVQHLVDSGAILPTEAERHPKANVVLRAIGARHAPELDEASGTLQRGDRFLLCSDGLTRVLAHGALQASLARPGTRAACLIEAALARTASDNLTAVVVDVIDEA